MTRIDLKAPPKHHLGVQAVAARRGAGRIRCAIRSSGDIPVDQLARMAAGLLSQLARSVRELDEVGGFDGRLIEQVRDPGTGEGT